MENDKKITAKDGVVYNVMKANFGKNAAAIEKDGKYGVINKNTKEILIKCEHSTTESFLQAMKDYWISKGVPAAFMNALIDGIVESLKDGVDYFNV